MNDPGRPMSHGSKDHKPGRFVPLKVSTTWPGAAATAALRAFVVVIALCSPAAWAQATSLPHAGSPAVAFGWLVAAGLVGVALLAYAIAKAMPGSRRDAPNGTGRSKPIRGKSVGSASRSEPFWDIRGGVRGRKAEVHAVAAPIWRDAVVPRVTEELAFPPAAGEDRAASGPAERRKQLQTRARPTPAAASASALPTLRTRDHSDRVWNMLDEIRHVPLAARVAPVAGRVPKRPAAKGVAAPASAGPATRAAGPVPTLAARLLPVPPVPPPLQAPPPPATAPAQVPARVPASTPTSTPTSASASASATTPSADGQPSSSGKITPEPARPAVPESRPDGEVGLSARWSDEKRAQLRLALDRLRASRDSDPNARSFAGTPVSEWPTTPRLREDDATRPDALGTPRPYRRAAEPSTRQPLQATTVERRAFAEDTVPQATEFQSSSIRRHEPHTRWVGPDQVVIVAGHAIPGMVYVGGADRFGGIESDPALIDDELDVESPGRGMEALDAANSSYASLEPAHRGAYLQWLAGGRVATAPASFALIFFMGLERRVIEIRDRPDALPELNRLAAEMRRLVDTHGMDSFSLHHHATRLAALVDMQSMGDRMYRQRVPALHRTYDLPVELRLALGQAAFDQVLLPADWALAWLLVDQTFHLRSPMTRCPEEFGQLFEARYTERFGAGVRLPADGRKLELTYMPVSRTLASVDGFHFPVDSAVDVDATCGAAAELRTLSSQCAEDLFEYCRYVGRHPQAMQSPDAELRLPAVIRPAPLKARIADLRMACQAGRAPASLDEASQTLWGTGLADPDSAGLLQALIVVEGITVRPGAAGAMPAAGGPT